MRNIHYIYIAAAAVFLHLNIDATAHCEFSCVGSAGEKMPYPGAEYSQEREDLTSCYEKNDTTVLIFDEKKWNFGDVQEDGGEVEHLFSFKNASSKPVVILDVSSGCGCTTPSFSRKPVLPGAEGEVKVVFDPMNRPGRFTKGVVVITSTNERYTLTVEGNVLPRKLTVEESYPFDLGEGLRMSSNFHAFSFLGRGDSAQEEFVVYNTSSRDAKFKLRATRESGLLKVESPSVVKAGGLAVIKLSYVIPADSKRYGSLDDVFAVVVNGKESKTWLSTHAIAVDKFDPAIDDMSRPSCKLSKNFIKFGDIKHGSEVENHSIEIINEGESELIIRAVEWKSQALKCSLVEGEKIAPGQSRRVELKLSTAGCEYGVWVDRLTLITNDVERPMVSVRLTAIVVE